MKLHEYAPSFIEFINIFPLRDSKPLIALPTVPPIRDIAFSSSTVVVTGLGRLPPRINTRANAERLELSIVLIISHNMFKGFWTKLFNSKADIESFFVKNELPNLLAISGLKFLSEATPDKNGLILSL
ncbi:hypothetical protein D3C84_844040 [compost metagenome]